ncbi:MAG: 3-oxoacyl-ACP reductase FabG [Armatimonadaceae bacterium]
MLFGKELLWGENQVADKMADEMMNRRVLITGGAGGVGTVVTKRWLEAGASVLVVDHAEKNLARLKEALPDILMPRLHTLETDVTQEDGANAMIAYAEHEWGQAADTLLHLVGGFTMGPIDGDEAPEQWRKMMDLNLNAVFHCYRAMVKARKPHGSGWIVGLGARAAVSPGANLMAYAAAKAGLVALTQALSAEVRDQGIHVNVLLASTIDTPANREAMGEKKADTWVTPDDIADATFYLCSERANAIHGATLEIYNRA